MKISKKFSSVSDKNIISDDDSLNDYMKYLDLPYNKSKSFSLVGLSAFCLLVPDASFSKDLIKSSLNNNEIIPLYLDNTDNFSDYESYIISKDDISVLIQKKSLISFNQLVNDILSFQCLQNDWDGHGAFPLENKSGVNAISLLEKLGESIYQNITDYYPNPNGTLSLEWEYKSSFLGLEVGNKEFSYFFRVPNNKTSYNNQISFENQNIQTLKDTITKMFI